MRIFFGGVRGSAPCAAPSFVRYGGQTTCLLVTGQKGENIMLDAGSGVRELNPILRTSSQRELLILMTHLHLDHVMGLPTLEALYDKRWHVEIRAGGCDAVALASGLNRVASPPIWPIALADMGSRLSLVGHDQQAPPTVWGGLKISSAPVPHPGGCYAWRVDEEASGSSFVFATDTEWSAESRRQDSGLLHLCVTPDPADLLIMDGHFSAAELSDHAGWGHSSVEQCVEVARSTGVRRLLVTHHNPDHDDDRLDLMGDELSRILPGAAMARQGDLVDPGTEPPERTAKP